jgi:hypothetical protein
MILLLRPPTVLPAVDTSLPPVPLVDPPASVTKYQPPAESGFGPTFNVYSTDRPYPESKSPTIRSKSSSARSHIPHSSSKPALRPSTPHAEFSFTNLAREHDNGADDNHRVIFSQLASKDESLSRDLKIPINASTPPPPFSPVSAHTVVEPSLLTPVPIMLARLLLLSFEGDYPLDVPPSEDELNAFHMTKDTLERTSNGQCVSSLKYLFFPFKNKTAGRSTILEPLTS